MPTQFDPDAFMKGRLTATDSYGDTVSQPAHGPDPTFDPDAFMKARDVASSQSGDSPVSNFLSRAGSQMAQIPEGIYSAVAHPINTAKSIYDQQAGLAREGVEAARVGDYPLAVARGLETFMPGVGPAIAGGFKSIKAGDTSGGLGDMVGALAPSLLFPAASRAAGRVLSNSAEPIAESALGIRNVDRKFGRNPGRAALDETSGVRPESIARQASLKIAGLSGQRDALVGASTAPTSLRPSIVSTARRISEAQAGNSVVPDLQRIQEHLTVPHEGFAGATEYPSGSATPISYAQSPSTLLGPNGSPASTATSVIPGVQPALKISEIQNPINALAIRQRLGKDFTKFDTARPVSREQMAVANEAYRNLSDEIHRAVPPSAPLDRRISNLILIQEAAEARSLEPGPADKMLTRIARPTGGLAAAALGFHEGGVPGALGGLAIPELLSTPSARMVAARGLDLSGKAARSRVATALSAGAPLVRPANQAH